jgi:hypothetical protein
MLLVLRGQIGNVGYRPAGIRESDNDVELMTSKETMERLQAQSRTQLCQQKQE